MHGDKGERWHELCEQAAKEQDANRLTELVREINRMLSEKEERLQNRHQPQAPDQPETNESTA
jgi:hypothetical protein